VPYRDWLTIWYTPSETDIVAYISVDRIVEIGGVIHPAMFTRYTTNEINQGMAVLMRWCRVNCSSPPKPVNVMGRTGFAFLNEADALLFKLTWG